MNANICKKCGACCYGSIGPLVFPSDVKIISQFLNISPRILLECYCEKLKINTINGVLDVYYIKVEEGHCMFLTENNLCSIYKYRPYQCINAPYKFLANSFFWNHMLCIDKKRLEKSNSEKLDSIIFREIIYKGYTEFFE